MKLWIYRLRNYTKKEAYYGVGDDHVCILEQNGVLAKNPDLAHWDWEAHIIISKNIAQNLNPQEAAAILDRLSRENRFPGWKVFAAAPPKV